jgi:hypothetical protein
MWHCDGRNRIISEIEDSLVLFRPFADPSDAAEVFIVHTGCTRTPLVDGILPRKALNGHY